jgi:hypothetical protein
MNRRSMAILAAKSSGYLREQLLLTPAAKGEPGVTTEEHPGEGST